MQFDAQAIAWREKLVEIDEDNLKRAQSWVRDIKVRLRLGEEAWHDRSQYSHPISPGIKPPPYE